MSNNNTPQTTPNRRIKYSYKTQIVHSLFTSSVGHVKFDTSSTLDQYYKGRIYICTRAVCFYSNLFGYERSICMKFHNISSIYKVKNTGIGFDLLVNEKDGNEDNDDDDDESIGDERSLSSTEKSGDDQTEAQVTSYVFKSISDRDEVLESLIVLWKHGRQFRPGDRFSPIEDAVVEHQDPATSIATITTTPNTSGKTPTKRPKSLSPTPQPRNNNETRVKSGSSSEKNSWFGIKMQEKSKVSNSVEQELNDNDVYQQESSSKQKKVTTDKEEAETSSSSISRTNIYNGKNEEEILSKTGPKQDTDVKDEWKRLMIESKEYFAHKAQEDSKLEGYTLDTFFDTFLDDKAEVSDAVYHKNIGDRVIETSEWKRSKDGHHLTRYKIFEHPVKGYGVSKTTSWQHCRLFGASGICIDSYVTAEGIPYADSFFVETRWFIEPSKTDCGLKLNAFYHCKFTKWVWMKGFIEKLSNEGSVGYFQGYTKLMQETCAPPEIKNLQSELHREENMINVLYALNMVLLLFILILAIKLSCLSSKMSGMETILKSLTDKIDGLDLNSASCASH